MSPADALEAAVDKLADGDPAMKEALGEALGLPNLSNSESLKWAPEPPPPPSLTFEYGLANEKELALERVQQLEAELAGMDPESDAFEFTKRLLEKALLAYERLK